MVELSPGVFLSYGGPKRSIPRSRSLLLHSATAFVLVALLSWWRLPERTLTCWISSRTSCCYRSPERLSRWPSWRALCSSGCYASPAAGVPGP